jgi:uncharacterized membrane protein YdjX (TVP38/TMEM64 family)
MTRRPDFSPVSSNNTLTATAACGLVFASFGSPLVTLIGSLLGAIAGFVYDNKAKFFKSTQQSEDSVKGIKA